MSNIYSTYKDFILNCNFGINPDKALEKLILVVEQYRPSSVYDGVTS